jgi:hypothetical protein
MRYSVYSSEISDWCLRFMSRKTFLTTLIISISLFACNQANPFTPSPTLSSGIEGIVTEGPMCPGPTRIGNPCPDQPYQTTITILDTQGKQLAQVQTDDTGHFKIQLKPGTYTLHPEPGRPFPVAPDQSVVIEDDQYTRVTVIYDTGIR